MDSPMLDAEDIEAVLDAVERFARNRVAPLSARPETPPDDSAIAALMADADALGLAAGGEPSGLWPRNEHALSLTLSLRTLSTLAAINAGIAHRLHQLALGRWLAAELGGAEAGLPALQGRLGLARTALARLLRGAPLDADDRACLTDTLGPGAGPRILPAAADWERVLAPVFDADAGHLTWRSYSRADLEVEAESSQHGLDELRLLAWQPRGPASGRDPGVPPRESRDLAVRAMTRQSLGLVAIAAGTARGALGQAREYAGQRVQGGWTIVHHPGVQQLLGRGDAAVRSVEAMLHGAAAMRDLGSAIGLRAVAHPLLCDAANDALQVLGGSGYMRDAGLEKRVRDCNQLRVLDGSPRELQLFLGAWEDPS